MGIRIYQRAFAGGEVSPEFWGRLDDGHYQLGLALCRNFVVKPQGPIENRAGTAFVHEVKISANNARLIPFVWGNAQAYAAEFGNQYVRFHVNGAVLLQGSPTAWDGGTAYAIGDLASSSGTNYYCILAHTNHVPPNATYWYAEPATGELEIPTPWAHTDLRQVLHYTQSADVMTLTHPSYPVYELKRLGATKWTCTAASFASLQVAPAGGTATPTGGTGTNYKYVVTSVGTQGTDESAPTSAITCTNGNLLAAGAYNTVNWSAAAGAVRYYVYKQQGGIYGYIGQSDSTSFVDNNIAADTSKTPPIVQTVFAGSGDYPRACGYYEQRRVFAGTTNQPQNVWTTKPGTESNMNYAIPARADDALQFRVAARENATIRHVVPLLSLLLLSSSTEWRVAAADGNPLAPANLSVLPQSYVGASDTQPVVISNKVVYVAARGSHLQDMVYQYQAGGYVSSDISIRAAHLFDGFDVYDLAYQKTPYPIVWAVSSSGKLLGCSYLPEQGVTGFHQHDTDGAFESCCVIPEGSYDVLYVLVRRTIGGATKRYVERLVPRMSFATQADAFFVDCGATYSGAPATTFSGLTWLEGKTVNILGDGAVMQQRTVTSGAVTIEAAVSKVQIGLPITADVQSLPLVADIPGFAQGRDKAVNKVWLRVYGTGGFGAGPTFANLMQYAARTSEPWGSPPGLATAEIGIVIPPAYSTGGQVCVRVTQPLPMTISAIGYDVAMGG